MVFHTHGDTKGLAPEAWLGVTPHITEVVPTEG